MGASEVARTITTAMLAGALALAACGGSDDSHDSPTPTTSSTQADKPTRAEYVRDLDALCKRTDEESADAERRFDAAADRNDNDGMVNALDEVLGQREEWMGELDAIAVPSSEHDFHEKYREGVERGFTLSNLLRDAIEANDLGDVTTYADAIRDSSRRMRCSTGTVGSNTAGATTAADLRERDRAGGAARVRRWVRNATHANMCS